MMDPEASPLVILVTTLFVQRGFDTRFVSSSPASWSNVRSASLDLNDTMMFLISSGKLFARRFSSSMRGRTTIVRITSGTISEETSRLG